MKTKLIFAGVIAFTSLSYAQNTAWPGTAATSNVGIGTTAPSSKFQVVTTTGNDGMEITQANTLGCRLLLNNQSTGGRNWGLYSLGDGNSQGPGNFLIYDQTGNKNRLLIEGSTGNIGIGTNTPYQSRLHVYNSVFSTLPGPDYSSNGALLEITTNQWGIYSGVKGLVSSNYTGTSGGSHYTGVYGKSNGTSSNGTCAGVTGEGFGSTWANFGGYFTATASQSQIRSSGVYATVVNPNNYSNSWAAYFDGLTYCSAGIWSGSDRRFKKEITKLENVSVKLSKLTGYSYEFNQEEFQDKKFDNKVHLGLIAQEIKEVFPELVREDSKGYYAVDYQGMIPVLLEGLKEQNELNMRQEALVESLQRRIKEQGDKIDQLSQQSSNTTGINSNIAVETGFQMSQNEPNPFTHETVVKYTLPQSVSNSFMAVYDLTGKQITTFPITEKGSSSLTITSEKLSAGIYIYSIVADGKVVDSKRMIVAEK